jgi:hypothetical protein
MVLVHWRQRTIAPFHGRGGPLKGLRPLKGPRFPIRQHVGSSPLGESVLVTCGAHLFPGFLPLGFPSAAARARHLMVPIDHRQEALVHPLPPPRRQDE